MCNKKIAIALEVDVNVFAQMCRTNIHMWEECNKSADTVTTTIC